MATRWGVVGCGHIANDFILAMKSIENFDQEHKLVAAAARDLDRAKEFAQKFGFSKAYGSYEELANDPEVEVVYIATMSRDHVEHAKLFMKHGKHVLCEKPLGVNVQQVKEALADAKEHNVFIMEAMWSRVNPVYVKMREEIDQGTIGEVLNVNCVFGYDQKFRDWMYTKELDGGGLLEIGIYNVHLATMVFWREKPVEIITAGVLNENGIDRSVTTTIVYPNGRSATSLVSIDGMLPNQAVIVGTKGTMTLKSPFWVSPALVTPNGTFTFPDHGLQGNFPRGSYMKYEAMEVRKCLQQGLKQSTRMSWEDSVLMHQILTDIRIKNGVFYDEDEPYVQ